MANTALCARNFGSCATKFSAFDLVSNSLGGTKHVRWLVRNKKNFQLHKYPKRISLTVRASQQGLGNQESTALEVLLQPVRDFWTRAFHSLGFGDPKHIMEKVDDEEEVGKKKILVIGATGKLGRFVVSKLLQRGYSVIATVASEERGKEILVTTMGLQEGKNDGGGFLRMAVADVNDSQSLEKALAGCQAVVFAAAARFAEGSYAPGSSPEDVFWRGVATVVDVAGKAFATSDNNGETETVLFDFNATDIDDGAPSSTAKFGEWRRLDDVIMGGISESTLLPVNGSAVFEGTVRVEGGGFCGARAELPCSPLDLSQFDGISMVVRGDGQRYKMNLRCTTEMSEFQHQASFNTVPGQWANVRIPWDCFKPVIRAQVQRDAAPLDPSQLYTLGLVLSRFQYEGLPNPVFRPGKFKLEIQSIKAYRGTRPQMVLVSSAAVERNARAFTPELRAASIPIVKLNPGGILGWKLAGEDVLRSSGLRYCIVRPCGLTTEDVDTPFTLEVAQGDCITGKISREEVATICIEALHSDDAVNTTFEVRRDELTAGIPTSNWNEILRRLRKDESPGYVGHS